MENQFSQADKLYDSAKFPEAFKLFLDLANEGDVDAMSRVACMYGDGEGISRDYLQSIKWDLLAIEKGSSSSMLNLAITYRALGDIKASKKWFEKSLLSGNGEAALHLAKLYMVSDKELETVRKYLKLTIDHDSVSEETVQEAKNLLDSL